MQNKRLEAELLRQAKRKIPVFHPGNSPTRTDKRKECQCGKCRRARGEE